MGTNGNLKYYLQKGFTHLKCTLFYYDMLITFCFGVSSNLSQQKSPTAVILGIYFRRTIFRRKYMHKISIVGLFCCDKFEETPKQKVINMSKLNNFHFSHLEFYQNHFAFLLLTASISTLLR